MTLILTLVGGLSMYHPGDGHNSGNLSCGGRLTWKSEHVAIRQWRKVGCGAKARVCVYGKARAHNTAAAATERRGAVYGDVGMPGGRSRVANNLLRLGMASMERIGGCEYLFATDEGFKALAASGPPSKTPDHGEQSKASDGKSKSSSSPDGSEEG